MSEQDMKRSRLMNKANFWNEIAEKFPRQFKIFAEWIDRYKKKPEIEWNYLFDEGGKDRTKFHDIPIGMQIGVFIEFVSEQEDSLFFFIDPLRSKGDFNNIPNVMRDWFEASEYRLKTRKNGE